MSELGPPPPGPPPPPPPPTPPSAGWGPPEGPQRDTGTGRTIPLHPLSLSELLDVSIRLYRGTIPQVLLAVVVVMGPLNLLTSLSQAGVDPLDPTSLPSTAGIVLALLSFVVSFFIAPLVNGAVTHLAARADDGFPESWQEAYRGALPRFPTLLLSTLLLFVLAVVGVAVLSLPFLAIGFTVNPLVAVVLAIPVILIAAVALVTVFYLVVPVVMLEEVAALEALKRSYELVRPRLLPVAGRVIVAGLLLGIVTAVASGVFSVLSVFTGPVGFVFAAIGGTLGSLISVPLGANIALVLYADQRMRQEGLDIQRLTERLPTGG